MPKGMNTKRHLVAYIYGHGPQITRFLIYSHTDIPLSERRKVKAKERIKGLSKVNVLIWKAIRTTLDSDFRIWIQVRFCFMVYAIYAFLIIRHEHQFLYAMKC
jgi:hypothetical protein